MGHGCVTAACPPLTPALTADIDLQHRVKMIVALRQKTITRFLATRCNPS
jgi:hypothetical protein